MTLYELTGDFISLLQMAEADDLDPQIIADTLEGIDMEIEDKAEAYAKVIRSIEGDSASVKAEIDRLTAKRRTMENNIESMKKALEKAMIATGKTKFKTTLFSFGIQKNPKSLNILDESMIPDIFMIPQPAKLDRKAALDYIKENGDQEWGSAVQTESIRIR